MIQRKDIDRRDFIKEVGSGATAAILATTGLGLLKPSNACASYDEDLDNYDFIMPRVKFACDARTIARWSVYPGADANLLREFSSVVRCKVKIPHGCNGTAPTYGSERQFNAVVDFTDMDRLRKYPFLFMTAEGEFAKGFNKGKRENLKQYIEEGGFLLMDDCVFNERADYFYQSAFRLLNEVFGPGAVQRVPNEHEVFHNVYDRSGVGMPYLQGVNHGARGVFVGDRLAVFLCSTDLHCGWAGCWSKGSSRYRDSIQMGINLIMYALSH